MQWNRLDEVSHTKQHMNKLFSYKIITPRCDRHLNSISHIFYIIFMKLPLRFLSYTRQFISQMENEISPQLIISILKCLVELDSALKSNHGIDS